MGRRHQVRHAAAGHVPRDPPLRSTAAILHLAHSVPAKLCFTVTDFNSYNTVSKGTRAN